MHIAIAGNIGSGKTTLTGLLAKHYKWVPHYENPAENPYINDFYNDMRQWSFNLQIYFLHSRFNKILQIRQSKKKIIQDRTIYEDAYIFAPNLHEMGLLSTRDYESYIALFELINSFIKPPELLIYLSASVPTLVKQIQKRGRKYESSIRLDYLQKLNRRYDEWIANYKNGKYVVVNIDEVKFSENTEDLGKITQMIDAELFGLF